MIKQTLSALLILSSLVLISVNVQATASCTVKNEAGELQFMPENKMKISIGSKMANDMTKETFNNIIDHVTEIFQPYFAKAGAKLTVNKRWDDDTVNASAMQWPNGNWRVSMYGGLARHQLITVDGLLLVLCHEIGHHIGGAPKSKEGQGWDTIEGQSDYFGSLKCFRRVVANEDNVSIVSKMQIDPEVTKQCKLIYSSENDIAICQRTSMAAFSVTKLLALNSEKPNISFSTPDQSRVSKTNEEHPEVQCRLDTYFQAALCTKSIDEDVINSDPTVGTCSLKDGLKIGLRPSCWYKH